MSYIVLIEWDGAKPPTKWYRRMESIGATAARDKDPDKNLTPLERRMSKAFSGEDKSVLFQEGAILCSSLSFAYIAYQYAVRLGASAVALYNAAPMETKLEPQDEECFIKIEKKLSRTGKPPSKTNPPTPWIVTCMEEAATFLKEDESYYVVNCPNCMGGNIRSRPGDTLNEYAIPQGDVFDAWKRHRFVTGEFEVAMVGNKQPPKNVSITDQKEADTVREIAQAGNVLASIAKMPKLIALTTLDAIFAARTHISDDARRDARSRSVVRLYQKGYDTSQVSITDVDTISILDGAVVVGFEQAANAWIASHKEDKNG